MTGALKPYPAMKDSGVPWLGQVPEHWDVPRLKNAFRRIVGGSTPSSAEASFWEGDVVWITPADVSKAERLRTSLRRITLEGLKSCSSELVPPGSIVVTSRAPVGNVAIADVELCTNQGCKALVVSDHNLIPSFGFAVLRSLKNELQSLASGTTFSEISTSRLAAVSMPLPPLPEQAAIVRFLDHADRRIRRYIRAKQKLIKLLEEQKQAIIHRAVTRGLDPNVLLKPSGVEWLGEVPEHWGIWQIGHFAHVGNGSTPSRSNPGYWIRGHYPWLNSSSVHRTPINIADQFVTHLALQQCHLPHVPSGSVLVAITGQGKTRGTAAVLQVEATINQHIAFITPRKGTASAEFLQLFLTGAYTELRRISEDSGSTKGALTCTDIKRFRIVLPPPNEQVELVSKLRQETRRIDVIIARTEGEIALLREYRTRLIADVVTGKLDVRKAAARLPDETEEPEPQDEAEGVAEDSENGEGADLEAVPEEAEA